MKKILLVEDDVWLAQLQAELLEAAGYNVLPVRTAFDAMDAVDENTPDIIIADVLLAGSTIFTLLNELQTHTDTVKIPVILCSSIADQFSTTQLADYGVKRVIDKTTMESDDLVVAVKAVLAA